MFSNFPRKKASFTTVKMLVNVCNQIANQGNLNSNNNNLLPDGFCGENERKLNDRLNFTEN